MAKQTKVGELVLDFKIKLEALEKGLETAKKKLEQIEEENKQLKNSNKGLESSFIAMSAVAVASFVKIGNAVKDAVNQYNRYTNSMNALNKTAKATGNTMSDVQNIISDVNEFKLMDEGDLNSSIKNLLNYGFTAQQTSEILNVLQDAAVGNRQECYTLSEAVRVTTEGIRMENSVLSDAAGVQKNISKMYEDYAKTLGKTTDALSQAEKAQAVYNGIMAEASMFTGSAKEMAEGYQGQQAQLNATTLDLQRTFGEAMIPTMTELTKVQNGLLTGITSLIKENKAGIAGFTTFTTILLGASVAIGAGTKAIGAYKAAAIAANMTTKAFTLSLLANPLFVGALAISVGIGALSAFNTKMQESIDKMEEQTEKSKQLVEALKNFKENDMTYTDAERGLVEEEAKKAEEIIKIHNDKKAAIEKIENDITNTAKNMEMPDFVKKANLESLNMKLRDAKKAFEDFKKENIATGQTIEFFEDKVKVLTKTLELNDAKQEFLTQTNISANRQALINIAQTKADIEGKKELLNILKQGKTGTEEYTDAKNQLVKVYPELARVNENTIASTEKTIEAEEKAAESEWNLAQETIKNSIAELNAMKTNDELVQNIAVATKQKVDDVKNSIEAATNSLIQLSNLVPEDFKGSIATATYKPKTSTKSSGGSSSYSNKALDNYKKDLEYKKSLDKLSLEEEIAGYEYALKKYAKTQDEKRELTTKIYELRKSLQEKELDDFLEELDYKKSLDQLSLEEEIKQRKYALNNLAKTTEQRKELIVSIYELEKELEEDRKEKMKEAAEFDRQLLNNATRYRERYIEKQEQLRGAEYAVEERTADLDEIIKRHREYLNQILKDERYSLEERRQIWEEELDIIADYEKKKRDLRISAIDNTLSQLKNAITKQYEEMKEAEEKAIEQNIELVEKWRDARIDAINAEYDARIEAINKELDALNKAEKQKTRDEEDADYEKKRLRLEQLIAYEHDATTKANYEKELAKLTAEHNKTLEDRALEDKKENLKEQQDLLKEEQKSKIEAIEAEAQAKIDSYNRQLEAMKEYYDKQIAAAEKTAQQLLLNVENSQEEILRLLETYGDGYEITGQTFGEKLAQGFADVAMQKIQSAISTIQKTIDAAVESNIQKLASQSEMAANTVSGSGNTTINKTINVEQNNTITTPVDSPSVMAKKQETLNQKLAMSLSYIV